MQHKNIAAVFVGGIRTEVSSFGELLSIDAKFIEEDKQERA